MLEVLRARRLHHRGRRLWAEGRHEHAVACASRAAALLQQRQHQNPSRDATELAAALITLADYHADLANHAAAELVRREAIAVLSGDPETEVGFAVNTELVELAGTQRSLGHYADAEATLGRVLSQNGPDLPPALRSSARNCWGIVCKDTGRYEQAADHYHTAMALSAQHAPEQQAAIYHNLAGLAYAQGRFEEAEPPARRALALREQTDGPNSDGAAADTAVLGAVLSGQGRLDEAEALLRRAIDLWSSRFGPEHYEVAVNLHNLGLVHQQRGAADQAVACLREALRIKRSTLGADHVEVGALLNNLGVLYATQGRDRDALACYADALPVLEAAWGRHHPATAQCQRNRDLLDPAALPAAAADVAPLEDAGRVPAREGPR